MTQSQLAFQAQMGDFLRNYKSPINIHTIINAFVPSRTAFAHAPSADIVRVVQFPDVSFYQGEINFDVMKLHTRAIIIRAGQNLWTDVQFARNFLQAKQRGLLVGAYWFYDDRIDPGRQADLLISLLRNKKFELEVLIDWENSYGGSFKGLGNVVAMMQRVENAGLDIKDVGLYTGYYFFRANSNPIANASQYNYLKSHPLWEAWYTTNPANVLIPAPWTKLTHWQFGTPAVNWGQKSSEIDMNYFNGTQQEFDVRYGNVAPPPPEEEVDYYEIKSNSTTDYRSIRQSPDVRSSLLYRLLPGQIAKAGVTVDDVYIYTTDVPNGTGGYWAKAGDMWRKVYNYNGTNVTGWIAKIHLGVTYITERLVTVVEPPPPPPPTTKTHQIDVYADGKISIDGNTPF